jgi:hypothetical protein
MFTTGYTGGGLQKRFEESSQHVVILASYSIPRELGTTLASRTSPRPQIVANSLEGALPTRCLAFAVHTHAFNP